MSKRVDFSPENYNPVSAYLAQDVMSGSVVEEEEEQSETPVGGGRA